MLDAESIELSPSDYFTALDIVEVFRARAEAPLEVDIGSGDGSFLVEMAERHPERNFLGLERLLGRVRKTCRRAARLGLDNVRVLRIENAYAVRHLLPPGSVSTFHILFPDPWPKRRHWRRRLIQPPFLDALAHALHPGGELRIKTDDAPYFAHIRAAIAERAQLFRELPWPETPEVGEANADADGNSNADDPLTDFERRFVARGLPIYRARLVKT